MQQESQKDKDKGLEFNPIDDFSSRGKKYQIKVVQALFEDRVWAEQIFEILKEEYFDMAYLQVIVGLLKAYYEKYQVIPSDDIFVSLLSETLTRDGEKLLRDQIIDFITTIKSKSLGTDAEIIKDTALKFCLRKALGNEIVKIAHDVQFTNFSPDDIIQRMQKAAYLGASRDVGHSYTDEISRRYELIERNGIPTGFAPLDAKNVLNGGIEAGEIGTVIAASGVGKSVFLVQVAANALRMGYNVIYYTLELSEHKIGIRFDANVSEISQSDVPAFKDLVMKSITENYKGKLYIKAYPPRAVSVNHFRNHIKQLKTVHDFTPDLIIVDYADLVAEVSPTKKSADSSYESQGSVYEQLRAFSGEVGCPIWTASQGTRSATSERIVKAEHIAESFRKMHTADVAFGLSRTHQDKIDGTGRLSIIKNRAGSDDGVFPITMNPATATVNVLDPFTPESLEIMEENHKKSANSLLMKKLSDRLDKRKE